MSLSRADLIDDLDPLERKAINGNPAESSGAIVSLAYHARHSRASLS